MADIEFDEFLDYQPLGYRDEDIPHGFDQWSEAAFLESHAAVPIYGNQCLEDIEHIYTGLHKCVEQVVAQISVRTSPRLDQIREQIRKLLEKLTTLESAITRDAAGAVVRSVGPCACPPASAPSRRRVTQSKCTGYPKTGSVSTPSTQSVSEIRFFPLSGRRTYSDLGR